MNFAPASKPRTATMRPNALRITRAQKAIAAAMNGIDPAPEDLAGLRETRVDEQTLHLSAAAALRQVLMSRPGPGAPRTPRRGGPDQQLIRDAYYLALGLADRTGNLSSALRGSSADWIAPAALVGRLQVRFLEQVCAQVDMTANHLKVPAGLGTAVSRTVLRDGGRIAAGTVLLADHTASEARDRRSVAEASWLHASSAVIVAGRSGPVVVDAGPDTLNAAWSARIAAPITVTAAEGRWPVNTVEDCLQLCAPEVRRWVASMARQLSGRDNEDLLLRIGAPLRKFLVSPASAAIAAAAATDSEDSAPRRPAHHPAVLTHGAADSAQAQSLDSLPLMAVTRGEGDTSQECQAGLLTAMRAGGEPGSELAPDTVLNSATEIAEIHRDEMTLLAAAPVEDLDTEIEVTMNFPTAEWQDVATLVSEVREAGTVELKAPVLGWADQEVITGTGYRLSLRARVRAGVALHTNNGYAVLLAAGTRLSLLGADSSKTHTTLYVSQADRNAAAGNVNSVNSDTAEPRAAAAA